MPFTFRLLPSLRWEVLRGDGFIMAVFGTRSEASAYCLRKNSEAAYRAANSFNAAYELVTSEGN